jgi:hypothetical protein
MLAATWLVDHDKDETLQFAVPPKPGDYEYVCIFPGHHLVMRGIMQSTPQEPGVHFRRCAEAAGTSGSTTLSVSTSP